ncbi:MAG: TonB-dependent receptor [Pseudomonadota bacterium]
MTFNLLPDDKTVLHRFVATTACSTIAFSTIALGGALAQTTSLTDDQEDGSDEIVVVGTRLPTPINEVGRSVTVIGEEEIAIRQQRFLYDALEIAPGVQLIRSGSFGGLSSVSIRGLPSDQTLFVIDGIVANNPAFFGNTFDFANIDPADISKVEVLRGGQSTLYGSDAIAGVINVVTKDGREGFGVDAFLEGGSFGTFRGAASVQAGNETTSGRLTISGITSDGFSSADERDGNTEDDGYSSVTLSGKFRSKLTNSLEFEGTARYIDSVNEFDGFPPPNFVLADADNDGETRDLLLSGSLTHTAFDGQLENRARVTFSDSDILNFGNDFVTFDADGQRVSIEHQAIGRVTDYLTLVGGFEFEREKAETGSTGGQLSISTTSGFALAQIKPTPWAVFDAGVRVDNNSEFGSETTFSASGSISIPGTPFRVLGSYAEGFQAPTSGELQFNLAQAATFAFDPSLSLTPAPERSSGFDIGLAFESKDRRYRLQATYFDQTVDQLLTFLFVPGAPNFGVFTNLEEFQTRGVEIGFGAQLFDGVFLDGSYTYVDSTNVTLDVTARNQPEHRVNAQLRADVTDNLTISTGLRYNGEEPSGFTTLDPFTVVDLRADYQVRPSLAVFGRVENILDEDYQDNLGFGTAPASFYVGVRSSF